MKKTVIGLILPAILIVSCSKNKDNRIVSPSQASIAGRWTVDTVTLSFYNSSGLFDSTILGYPIAGINDPLYFQFEEDSSWFESLVAGSDTTVVTEGTYSYTSSDAFTLMYPNASPVRKNEPCSIISLTNTSFIFSKQRSTVFNGTNPGSIKYVFKLRK